jgi:hypothetical protein
MRPTALCIALASVLCATVAAAAPWHYPLYLANGGYWRQRVEVSVHNTQAADIAGKSMAVTIGTGPNEANLVGAEASAVRVCDAQGAELLFALSAPGGRALEAGPIPAGATLTVPVTCPASQSASLFVYFDNPQAWPVPDFLKASLGVRNPGVEEGSGDAPDGWSHDPADEQHQAMWTTEAPRSGKRCLKTVVAEGAEPTWIATRQRDIKIIGGARYVMRAWVKAQNVKGSCGWYIHVGNSTNSMIISPMLTVSEPTFDWREVKAEFTAPAEADLADLGTVLRGTGTAWFDDVSLECLDAQDEPRPTVGSVERLALREVGPASAWYDDNPADDLYWDWRVPVRVLQMPGDEEPAKLLVAADIAPLVARMRGKFAPASLRVVGQDGLLPHSLLKDTVLFEARLAPGTATTFYLYLSADPRFSAPQRQTTVAARGDDNTDVGSHVPIVGEQPGRDAASMAAYERLLSSSVNLVRNASFEDGVDLPDAWPGSAEGTRPEGAQLGLAEPGLFGKRCVRMYIPHTSQKAWTGWRQDVPVTPGKTYLYAAWLKCEDLQGGSLQLHAHKRTATGEMVKSGGFTGAGPAISGTTDWTLISGVFTMPDDGANFQVHLTMLATGTAWHDGAVVAEVAQATTGATEGRGAADANMLTIWPVNAVVKVFREDPAPRTIEPARITAARNDREPLQLAVRSPQAVAKVQAVVDTPIGPDGARLSDCAVEVVGYVPMDTKSNYYSTDVQPWQRRLPPAGGGGSDGWAGWWPDPLLPRDNFSLEPNATQPIWVTVSVPKDAAPGDYRGAVRFLSDGAQLASVPFVVHVWDFEVPDQLHTAAVYDMRMGGRWNLPGKSPEEVRNQFLKFMADHRVCPDRVSPDPVLRYENGKVVADFTAFDKAAEYYFDVLKMPHTYTPGAFYCFGWGHPPGQKFGQLPFEGTYPYEGVDRSKLRPEFIEAYQACLRAYLDHMKQKGWYDRVVLYISDEPYDTKPYILDQMKALCAMIREVDPKLPIYCSNWHHQPAWDGSLTLWGIGHYGVVPTETIGHIRDTGARMWFTTDGQMCTDTPYCAVERLLPRYCFKYGVDAYEFWGCTWLTYDPYKFGWHSFIYQSGEPGKFSWVRYPNGDGFLAYPGAPIGHDGPVSSVRLEQAREGVEDYEYLYLLRERIAAAKAAGRDVAAAQRALDEALDLVQIPNAGGRYSTRILPDPDRLPVLKEAVARAIESLR